MRRLMTLSLLTAAGFGCAVFAQEPEDPNAQKEQQKPKFVPKDRIISAGHKVSNERIAKIQAVLQKYYKEHKNLESSAVISDIRRDIEASFPLVPKKKADNRNLIVIKKSIQPQVDKKFTDVDKIKKAAEAEAEKKFPLAKIEQEVKVYYTRGGRTYAMTGIFYGYGAGGRSIKLNSRHISFYDLTMESKALFDKKNNEHARKDYIQKKVEDYKLERTVYAEKLFAKEYAKIRKENEKLGYIYQNGNWVSAETILKQSLPEFVRLYKERAEKERLEKEAREKAQREAEGEKKKNDEAEEDDE